MGLFNRNKEKKKVETEKLQDEMDQVKSEDNEKEVMADENSSEAATTERAQAAPHVRGKKEERFTFMVEEIKTNEAGGVIVRGFANGRIKTGDWFYIYHPALPHAVLKADFIELAPGELSYYAENQQASIGLQNITKESLPIFTVFSNIESKPEVDINKPIENPNLLGILSQHQKFKDNPDYLNLLIYLVVHSNYLMAVYFSEEPEVGEDGKAVLKSKTTIGFPCISLDEKVSAVPAFTDWVALTNWKNVFNEEHPPKTIIHNFSEVAAISLNGNQGIAINPFGTSPIFFSNDMIKKVMSLEAYQREFGPKKENETTN